MSSVNASASTAASPNEPTTPDHPDLTADARADHDTGDSAPFVPEPSDAEQSDADPAAPGQADAEQVDAVQADSAQPDSNATFADLGLSSRMLRELGRRRLDRPFPIQAAAIPDVLAGRDVLGRGRTGSGKTLAFGLPTLDLVADSRARRVRPLALALVPTRELAMQVKDALTPFAKAVDARVTAVYGGVPLDKQIRSLRRGVDLLVATPGRLMDLVRRDACRLDAVETAILDEADRMADLGFLPIVTEILDLLPPHGQRLLFSATLDRGIDQLVAEYLNEPVVHEVDPLEGSVTTMQHRLLHIAPWHKSAVTAQIAARRGRTIVFARTKLGVDRIVDQLQTAGVAAEGLHSDKSQGARTRILSDFRRGGTTVLVATDVAARGIHVDDVDLVLHVDPAADAKDYLHRAGRTARAGTSGTVATLVLPHQRRHVDRLMADAGVTAEDLNVAPGDEALGDATGARIDLPTADRRGTPTGPPRRNDGPRTGDGPRSRDNSRSGDGFRRGPGARNDTRPDRRNDRDRPERSRPFRSDDRERNTRDRYRDADERAERNIPFQPSASDASHTPVATPEPHDPATPRRDTPPPASSDPTGPITLDEFVPTDEPTPRRRHDDDSPRRDNGYNGSNPRQGNDYDRSNPRQGNGFHRSNPRQGNGYDRANPRQGNSFDRGTPRSRDDRYRPDTRDDRRNDRWDAPRDRDRFGQDRRTDAPSSRWEDRRRADNRAPRRPATDDRTREPRNDQRRDNARPWNDRDRDQRTYQRDNRRWDNRDTRDRNTRDTSHRDSNFRDNGTRYGNTRDGGRTWEPRDRNTRDRDAQFRDRDTRGSRNDRPWTDRGQDTRGRDTRDQGTRDRGPNARPWNNDRRPQPRTYDDSRPAARRWDNRDARPARTDGPRNDGPRRWTNDRDDFRRERRTDGAARQGRPTFRDRPQRRDTDRDSRRNDSQNNRWQRPR